jgi:DNA-binding transcriptional ArsR family regulator
MVGALHVTSPTTTHITSASKTSPRPRISATLNTEVLLSCHQTLIHLGDLSRYREAELVEKDKERNWGPAKGYYGLAAELYPDSGHAQNQLAVISREDGDHFRSVYHLFRSLASKLPYPQAQANLETEFKRIIAAWDKGQLIDNHKSSDGNNAGRALIAWFVRLHSRIYKGEEFAAHDELEGEVLSHLAIELKERSLDSILPKIILINLAAEYFATVQMQGMSVLVIQPMSANTDSLESAREHYANVLLLPAP